ncbi:WGxxGxxG family protein [Luteococcus peritonei]|uniref:WGxxGxxG family protein n=1 Tax=Luteococcus peritonei TaxID=88874 RepID=A0ABW4RVA8_9ACTN
MRKTLAASALAGVVVLGAPQIAEAQTATPTPSPTATATATETETTTKTVHEKDRTGLWGLTGLLGLAGLAGLRKKPEHHTTVRPAHVETRRVETNHDVRNDVRHDVNRTDNLNSRTDNLRQGDLNNDGRRDI